MGDLNTGYFQPSQQLLRHGHMDARQNFSLLFCGGIRHQTTNEALLGALICAVEAIGCFCSPKNSWGHPHLSSAERPRPSEPSLGSFGGIAYSTNLFSTPAAPTFFFFFSG